MSEAGRRTAPPTDGDDAYDFAKARRYWRHAPSGAGKHDTSSLQCLSDAAFEAVWDDAFVRRFRQYPEEDVWLRQMAGEFAGRDILSIGSGLGLHEIHYMKGGARIVCCDIVESNLKAVQRIAAIKGLPRVPVIVLDGGDVPLPGSYDVVFLYGSLMAMPSPQQRDLLRRCQSALRPNGRIVLMLYTWEFARDACGWSTKDQFDPVAFARASDPTVGSEHCPWSDWHDRDKLEELTDNRFRVTREQRWNNGWFVWYEMSAAGAGHVTAFFPLAALAAGDLVANIEPASLLANAAALAPYESGTAIETESGPFGYAASTGSLDAADARGANALLIEGRIVHGGFSVGVLDEAANAFIATAPFFGAGEVRGLCRFDSLPARYRIIFSNHRTDAPGSSSFNLDRITFIRRPTIDAPARPPAASSSEGRA